MSKFIYSIFRFLIICLIIYIPLVILWSEFNYNSFVSKNIRYELLLDSPLNKDGQIDSYGHMFTRLKELDTISEADLLILGSSQAYRGLDTRIFNNAGFNSFNLGSSNQTPVQSDLLLKEYITKLHPKTIIYVVYPESFTMDGVESTLNLLSNSHIDFAIIKLALMQMNLKVFNTLIYSLYRDIFNLNTNLVEPKKKWDDTYIKGGYVEKDLAYWGYHNYEPSTWEFNNDQFEALEKSIEFINENDIRLIFVQSPTPKSFYLSQTNNDYFDTRINNYGEYYNFNNIITLDDSLHFYDEFHLNQDGVRIFNEKLLEIL